MWRKEWNGNRDKNINTVNIDSTSLAVNLFMMTEMLINLRTMEHYGQKSKFLLHKYVENKRSC